MYKCGAVTGAAFLVSAGVAHAQLAPSGVAPRQANPQAAAVTVEDVVVTATRESTTLQNAPAPINVVSGATIEKLHVDNVSQMTALVPGLKVDGNAKDQLRLGLRGAFASSQTPGAGLAVGLYIDQIPYIHTNNLGNQLFGVRQVEVLRGPQGTLYGQNVTGGLITITTAEPTRELSGEARASYSSHNRIDVGGLVSGPLTDDVAASVSLYSTRSSGWQRNLVTGNKLDQLSQFGARTKVVWTPNDRLRLSLIGEYTEDKTYGQPRNFIFGTTSRFAIPDWKSTNLVYDGRYDSKDLNLGAIVEYKIGGATLSSITSYQKNRPYAVQSPFVTDPVAYQTTDRRNISDTYTEELRASAETGRLHWQTGAFFLRDVATQDQTYHTFAAPGSTLFVTNRVNHDVFTHQIIKVKAQSESVFAQGTYDFNDILSLTVGGRYNWDKKDAVEGDAGEPSAAIGIYSGPVPFVVANSLKSKQFSPRVTLSAKWADVGALDDLLVYATYSKGYRTGDFSAGATAATSLTIAPPEIAKNYEAGFKSTFLNRKVLFNVTGFRVDYTDLQTLTVASTGIGSVASTSARAWGVEATASVRPFKGFTVTANYAYLHTKVGAGALVGTTSVAGMQLPQSPPHSYDVSASYTTEVAADSELRFTASYTYKDPVYFDVRNARTAAILDQTRYKNLSGEVALVHGRFEFSVWGKNLTDNKSVVRALGTVRTASLTIAEAAAQPFAFDGVYADPRSVGMTIKYSY